MRDGTRTIQQCEYGTKHTVVKHYNNNLPVVNRSVITLGQYCESNRLNDWGSEPAASKQVESIWHTLRLNSGKRSNSGLAAACLQNIAG